MERLWPGTFVTDDVLVQCVVDIRRALHDPAKTPHYVQTVPRRGYQFLAPVREAEPADWETPPDAAPPVPGPAEAPANGNGHPAPEPTKARRLGWWPLVALALLLAVAAPPRPSRAGAVPRWPASPLPAPPSSRAPCS